MAAGEEERARGAARDEQRHVRRDALRSSWGRALAVAVAVGVATVVLLSVLEIPGAAGVGLVPAALVVLRWWRALPARKVPDDAVVRGWDAIAEGERRSAVALRRLVRQGWTVVHDPVLSDGRSLGQVVIGPSGVATLASCVAEGPLALSDTGVWLGDQVVDVVGCAAAAQSVCDVVATELSWPGVRVMPVLVVHGTPVRPAGHHVAGVAVVGAAHLFRYLQQLRLGPLEAETVERFVRALLARLDVAGQAQPLDVAGGRYRRSSS